MSKKVITFGTFDVFHIGHLNILRRAKELGNHLTVGVSSDKLNFSKKSRLPVYPESERMAIVAGIRYVDEVFLEESLELKSSYIQSANATRLVMGDDWIGRFDSLSDMCEVVYLPRTASVSTTDLMAKIKRYE
jgi:glycerol-3-phosphate cytidylyltransferase